MTRVVCASLAILTSVATACTAPSVTFSEDPIALVLAGDGGGLIAGGSAELNGMQTPSFPMLVDTASPVTVFSGGSGTTLAARGELVVSAMSPAVPRLHFSDIQLIESPLGPTGLDVAQTIGGVLGGDNLRRFVLGVTYAPSPTLSLTNELILTECELSERCGAVLPFSIAGGRRLVQLGDDIYNYPASYVLIDACIEPALDPLESGVACRSSESCGDLASCTNVPNSAACIAAINDCRADATRYVQVGIDVRFAVATGFPGLGLSASAYDRLRGLGSAASLIAESGTTLYLPDQAGITSGLAVGRDKLGAMATKDHDGAARSALALVDKGVYFGACAELARSRRLRRHDDHPDLPAEASCLRSPDLNPNDALLQGCSHTASPSGLCDDRTEDAHTNAYVDIIKPIPILVVPDTTSILQSINADVRPQSATVEGVIGTELLRRLGTTIDYADSRVVVTCADASCISYPTSRHGTDCHVPGVDHMFGGAAARITPGGGCATP